MKYWNLFTEIPNNNEKIHVIVSDKLHTIILNAEFNSGKIHFLSEIPEGENPDNFTIYAWCPQKYELSNAEVRAEVEDVFTEYGKKQHEAVLKQLDKIGLKN